ncbi:MAG TPA: hypothetical protein VMT16_07735 [Thermoanaerobaculia bacterium]|nr:hypothetical protein [Thermoanaerobaculia bacterium]
MTHPTTRIVTFALAGSLGWLAAEPLRAEGACDDFRVLDRIDAFTEVLLVDKPHVVEPGKNQRAVALEATRHMTPLLCHAVTRLAYVAKPSSEGGSLGWVHPVKPDLVNMGAGPGGVVEANLDMLRGVTRDAANARAATIRSILHEAAHSATLLLGANDTWTEVDPLHEALGKAILGDDEWTAADHAFATEVIENNRLQNGFDTEWRRIHDAFVAAGLAKPHHHRGDPKMSPAEVVARGVMSPYAGDEVSEDIADTTAWVIVPPIYQRMGASAARADHGCQAMQAEPGPAIPERLAAVFTKVGLLQSAGFISDQDYRRCVGELRIRADGDGFFTLVAGEQVNSYTGDVEGTMGLLEGKGPYVFQIQARGTMTIDGTAFPARAELRLEAGVPGVDPAMTSFPRGLYRVRPAGPRRVAGFRVFYTRDGEEKLGIDVVEADVLVARASHDLVEGSIFVKRYVNYTELFPLPVPPKQEQVIAFRKR